MTSKENMYKEIRPTYLYIKQCSITKLKYFGKTYQPDPYGYLGSGVRWVNNYKKYGKENIITLWVSELYCDTSIQEIALHFSNENDIVNSDQWANLIPENGLDGGGCLAGPSHPLNGFVHDKKFKEDCSNRTIKMNNDRSKNRIHQWNKENMTKEHKDKLSKAKVGNQNAKGFKHTDESKLGCAKGGKAQMGIPKSKESIQKRLLTLENYVFITNGINRKFISKDENVPIGWVLGYPKNTNLGSNNPRFGKITINNGISSKLISKEEEIPEGWIRGSPQYFSIILTKKSYTKKSMNLFPTLFTEKVT